MLNTHTSLHEHICQAEIEGPIRILLECRIRLFASRVVRKISSDKRQHKSISSHFPFFSPLLHGCAAQLCALVTRSLSVPCPPSWLWEHAVRFCNTDHFLRRFDCRVRDYQLSHQATMNSHQQLLLHYYHVVVVERSSSILGVLSRKSTSHRSSTIRHKRQATQVIATALQHIHHCQT